MAAKKAPFGGLLKKMGNKLSCSCGPLKIKGYRFDANAEPWSQQSGINHRRPDGNMLSIPICRLWAEVFHVTTSSSGTVKWSQVSEDLVPVNITCLQDSPEIVFHITAYNSQVEKILDVRLTQPGTRIGQASECFVYWKDTVTNDTWGLNFTSPIDAKQFRECCDGSRLQSRIHRSSSKHSSRSTPASPSKSREPQCTCMTAEQFAKLRSQNDLRMRGSQTLPREGSKAAAAIHHHDTNDGHIHSDDATYSTNTNNNNTLKRPGSRAREGYGSVRERDLVHDGLRSMEREAPISTGSRRPNGKPPGQQQQPLPQQQVNSTGSTLRTRQQRIPSKSIDYSSGRSYERNVRTTASGGPSGSMGGPGGMGTNRRARSKSTDQLHHPSDKGGNCHLDSGTLKKMLKPVQTAPESPVTSPEGAGRRRGNLKVNGGPHGGVMHKYDSDRDTGFLSEPECGAARMKAAAAAAAAAAAGGGAGKVGRGGGYMGQPRGVGAGTGSVSFTKGGMVPPQPPAHHHRELYLDFDTDRGGAHSPPSDSGGIFDSHCFATTPSSSNGNSDIEGPASPTSQLLMDYEEHLRNTLEKGLDAESYSLQTFEALLSRSMENLEHDLHGLGPGFNPQTSYLKRKADRDRSRTMPSRIETRSVAGSYTARSSQQQSSVGHNGRYFHQERPRSVNSNFESGHGHGHGHGLGPASLSIDQSGYVSDKTDLGGSSAYSQGYNARRSSASTVNRCDRLRINTQPMRINGMAGKGGRQDSLRSGYMSDHETKAGLIVHQQISVDSVQSQDSRLCYLTSSEISDDDRMSLTTAISDEEEMESNRASPYKVKTASGTAASFNCTGAVRKAGFLSVKKWLLRKKHQVELARKRGWKGYWVCLKGTTLLFYPCDSQEGRSVEATPKHLIIVDGAIMQAIPEHPKRDFIFCLSTAFGDAYLFQAPCQVELENWVNSIHSACAAAFARHRGKTGTLHLLQEEIYRIEKGIESDQKLKHMAELQLSVVADGGSKLQIEGQIRQWEENLERLHCEQFRLRCYMASLQNGELPNPKGVLTQVTPATKLVLNRLGVFTVSSFHAYVCARSPSLLSNLLAGRGATKRRSAPPNLSRSNSGASRRSLTNVMASANGRISPDMDHAERAVKVTLPDNQMASLFLREAMTVEEFLSAACLKKGLNPVENFVRVKKRRDMPSSKYFVPHRSDLIETYLQTHEVVEVCAKILYQVELRRGNLDTMWGFSVEAELVENSDKQDELCCYVSRVEERSVAMSSGIIKGDEIMVINGAIVSDLDMMFIESVLQEELSLCMMMRSARTDPPELSSTLKTCTDDIIDSLVCPPPPSDNIINEDIISSLIVPAPGYKKEAHSPDGDSTTAPPSQSSEQSDGARRRKQPNGPISMIDKAMADSMRASSLGGIGSTAGGGTGVIIGGQAPLDVDALLRRTQSEDTRRPVSPTESLESANSHQMTPSRALSDSDKLRKVILELVETEQTYVENLARLMKTYFEPLSDSIFFSNSDISSLFSNIQEIFRFQQQFLRTLEEAVESETQFNALDSAKQFKNVLFSIGSGFLYYVNHFKLYSSFCANHSKAQKALHPTNKSDENQALQEFLQSCNRRQQHSTTLESYLIQPIQRILKYPLLLQQLKSLAAQGSDEQQHLVEALIGMERVAEHINEMQRIHEEYGAIFDHLFRQHQKTSKQLIDLSPGDLLYYGGVEWLNISDFLGKIKKGLELHAMCFVFKTAVVFLCKERLRQKKKPIIGPAKQQPAEVEIIRYQVLIPVTEVQVRASSVKDVDSHYLWELIHLKNQIQRRNEKIYHLSNSTSEFRNAFLKTIRQIIRESVRNMSLPGPESYRKPDSMTPPNAGGRSGSIDMALQKSKIPDDSVELDIHSETDSAREFSSGLRSDVDDGKPHHSSSYNASLDLGGVERGHMRHFTSSASMGGNSSGVSSGKISAKTASQPHLSHANVSSSAYNSADSDLGKSGSTCLDCQVAQQQHQHLVGGHGSTTGSLPPPQPPSRRAPPSNNNVVVVEAAAVDRSRLHVGGGSRCSAQSSIDTDQGSISTTGRESTTTADNDNDEDEEEVEPEEDESIEVPAPDLPPPPPLLPTADLGSPVWKPRDDSSVGLDHPTSSTSSTPGGADQLYVGHS